MSLFILGNTIFPFVYRIIIYRVIPSYDTQKLQRYSSSYTILKWNAIHGHSNHNYRHMNAQSQQKYVRNGMVIGSKSKYVKMFLYGYK